MSKLRAATLVVLAALSTVSVGCSLGIRQDYVIDRDMVYSADDPFTRGLVYRTQTGHAGHNYNCDGEEDKRYAPWIQWHQRPCDSQSCRREISEWRQSYDDACERWRMGSCQVCPSTQFPPGAGYGNEAELAADATMAPAAPVAVPQ